MRKENPFRYGCIVIAENFCPRRRLQKRLAAMLRSGQNVAVTGPRRVGKSSLIHKVAHEIRNATLVYVDLWGIRTMSDLVRRCVQALNVVEDKAGLMGRIARAFPGLTVTMGIDPVTGSPTLTPTLSTRRKVAPESVAQIARLWESLHGGSRKLVLALDELQDLMAMEESDQVLGLLRKEIQLLGTISFCWRPTTKPSTRSPALPTATRETLSNSVRPSGSWLNPARQRRSVLNMSETLYCMCLRTSGKAMSRSRRTLRVSS